MRDPRRTPRDAHGEYPGEYQDNYPGTRRRYPRRGSDQQEWAQNWGSGIVFLLLFFGYLVVAGTLYFLRGAYAASAGASLTMWSTLDAVFGATLIPACPALMWAFWGAVFGASLVFWLHAPIYGKRQQRPFILMGPLVAMVLVALVSALVAPPQAPAPDAAKSTVSAGSTANALTNSATNSVASSATSSASPDAANAPIAAPAATAPQ